MTTIDDVHNNLPAAMTMGAFAGIAWYICIELNIRLFVLFRRHRSLYFWSCAICSWGIILQPLFILMTDFQVWKNLLASVILIYLSWWMMVVPQSMVLYSRLHLVVYNSGHQRYLNWVLAMIIFTTVLISVPTIILGTLAVRSLLIPSRMIMDTSF
jgi:hypothetical protein